MHPEAIAVTFLMGCAALAASQSPDVLIRLVEGIHEFRDHLDSTPAWDRPALDETRLRKSAQRFFAPFGAALILLSVLAFLYGR